MQTEDGRRSIDRSTPPRPILQAGSLMALVSLLSGCVTSEEECSNIGCSDGVTLELRQAVSVPDEFTLTVEADDRQTTCSGRLAAYACDASDGWSVTVCGNPSVTSISVRGFTPSTVHLVLESGGSVLLDETVTAIQYESRPVGGGGCAACDVGHVQL